MHGASQFELHATAVAGQEPVDIWDMAWKEQQDAEDQAPPFVVTRDDGLVWAELDQEQGGLRRVDSGRDAAVGLRVLKRRFSNNLAMIARQGQARVNGLEALPFSVLDTKDSVLLAPGRLFYVTERVRPHVGPPTEEMLADKTLKCPFCRMKPADAKPTTRVVSCRCGVVYHHETAESHPDKEVEKRLNCFEKVKACLSCGREMSLNEYLIWNPAE